MKVNHKATAARGYAPVNGLNMYYEIEGSGDPFVYIPPAFGYAALKSFPELVQSHSLITVDLHGQGRTADIPDRPITFHQHAKDVVVKHFLEGPEEKPPFATPGTGYHPGETR